MRNGGTVSQPKWKEGEGCPAESFQEKRAFSREEHFTQLLPFCRLRCRFTHREAN